MFSISNIVPYELLVYSCADLFEDRLSEFARSNEAINLGHWIQCYSSNDIASVIFGRRFRLIDEDEDIERVI